MRNTVLGVILLIVAFTLLFTACVTVDKVASAEEFDLPSTGIVGDNLLLNSSDFTSLEYWNNLGDLGTLTLSNGIISFSGDGCELSQESVLDTSFAEYSDLVCSFYVTSVTGTVFFSCTGAEHITSVIRVEQGLNVYRFSLLGSGSVVPLFSNYTIGAQFSLQWIKLEYGTDFTGFVPNDYEHYGYDEGRTSGIESGVYNVEYYNNGIIRVGEYYDYSESQYSSIDVIGGGSISYPLANIAGDNCRLFYSNSRLVFQNNANTLSTISVYGFNQNDSSPYQIFALLLGTNSTEGLPVTFTYGSFTKTYTFDSFVPQSLVVFKFPMSPTSTFDISIPRGELYLFKYKYEVSRYFTGFPLASADSSQSQYNDGFNSGYSLGLEEGRTQGYTEGNAEGYDIGYGTGYGEGDINGYNRGRSTGYTEGLQTAQEGTWLNMLSGLIDVPVQAITGFLNIDILGFNMLNLFRTVLIISLFAYVLKFMIGKVA